MKAKGCRSSDDRFGHGIGWDARGNTEGWDLFGPGSVSSVSDVAEAQTGWPTEDEFPEGARSPGVDLADVVARLQKEVEAGPGLRQRLYPCLRVRLVGTSTIKCLRPLDGMV